MNEKEYLTLGGSGESRYEEKRSAFLGFAAHFEKEEDVIAWLASLKRAYPDARHHVYAYRLRESNTTRYSDDREPQGTAGMPTLDVLRGRDLYDCAVCVIRYFGGTLLGTGGLVHAYGTAAADAVKSAGIVRMTVRRSFTLPLSYADHPRVASILSDSGATISDVNYAEGVTLTGTVDERETDELARALSDATAGRAVPEWGDTVFSSVPVEP
ncbi:MAG: YigZ family protein [Clostridia bacterium]|nr:YigZ family protein [Clostridia bacterium]